MPAARRIPQMSDCTYTDPMFLEIPIVEILMRDEVPERTFQDEVPVVFRIDVSRMGSRFEVLAEHGSDSQGDIEHKYQCLRGPPSLCSVQDLPCVHSASGEPSDESAAR